MASDIVTHSSLKDASFTDIHGAAITVPANKIPFYVMLRAEQLDVLNGLIADKTAGFAVELTENVTASLAGIASELAHMSKKLCCVLTDEALSFHEGEK